MEIPVTQLPPGDPRLVEAIVGQLKSKGIFDQFRKECLADVDTKPAFQNLRQRVEGQVNKFLEKKIWKNDMNKNQLRDGVRKHVNSLGILDTGIDAIITQVVNPKIKPLILPYVEDTVYAFLQIDKPKRGRKDSELEVSPVPPKEEETEMKIKPEEIPEAKPALLPMETDVISSEEDDILARESPEGDKKSASSSESDVAIDENARDGFENCPQYQEDTPEDIATNVERLHLSEDDSKSPQAAKPPLPLFDDQSLDSISSNSSGLTFSPLTDKGSPESKKSLENTPKSDDNSKTDARSATSTPLVDEKPVDESSQSSLASDPSKEFESSEKMYPTDKMLVEHEPSTPSHSAITSSARSAKDGASVMSVEEEEDSRESKESFSKTSRTSEKSEVEEKAKSEKSEGEISSSSSELSDVDSKSKPETSHSDEKNHSDYESSHKSRSKSDHKKKHDSYGRDRDREREKDKDSRHHRDKERKHSKSRDDHHSHRDKDKKHHRRDKDHDGDKDRSRSHHHQSSSSHKESSGSSRSSGDRDKDRSGHHSSGKSSEGKSRSKQSGDKAEGKSGSKTETKSDDKVDGKYHGKDDSKQDKKHGNSDKKSDSKSDGKRDKRSEERTKENSDGRQEKPSEGKSESKSKRKTEEIDSKFDGKSHKSWRDSSSSKHKKTECSGENSDSKKHKHSHRSKNGEKKENLNEDVFSTEEKTVSSEKLEENENVHNGESTIDAHMLGFSSDNIIVADDEGNLMLLTYEDDTDSISSECPTGVKSGDSSCSETLPSKNEIQNLNDFEGFENTKGDQRLAEYLLMAEKVPDEMDMECSDLFDESDLHITLYENSISETALSDFLKCMQRLGAVIKNEKGEIEDHSTKPTDSMDAKEKNASQIGKRRRISNSSSISSSSSSTGSPKHKRFRRESSAASDTSQMLEQDSVIVSGYALLTPEDDGNRSMGREYDLDYNQKMSNYSPLSPVSDSSADEGKSKGTGTSLKSSVGVTKPSSEIDHKTEMWPNKEAKFSV